MATISTALPKSTEFVWLFYKVYLAIAIGHFVDLTLQWYGGVSAMLHGVGEGTVVKFRVPPCCCLFCVNTVEFSKDKITIMRALVYQVPYVQAIVLFIMACLNMSG